MAVLTLQGAFPGVARAGESSPSGRLAVVGFGRCEDGVLTSAVRLLRSELSARADARVLTEEATAAPGGGLPRGTLAEVHRIIEAGKAEFLNLNAPRAEQTLRGALPLIDALLPGQARWEAFRSARIQLARVLQYAGQQSKASEFLMDILRVQEDFSLDAMEFPPSFRELLEVSRSALAGLPRFDLKVQAGSPGASVFVNGYAAGVAPLVRRMVGGSYELVVSDASGRSFTRSLALAGDTRIEVDPVREGRFRPAAGPCLDGEVTREERLSLAALLASVLPIEQLVAVRVEVLGTERYVAAALIEPSLGREVREGRVRLEGGALPALDRLAQFVLTGQGAPGPGAGKQVAVPLPPPPPLPVAFAADLPGEPAGRGGRWQRPASLALAGVALGLGGAAGYQQWRAGNLDDELAALVVAGTGGAIRPEDLPRSQQLAADYEVARGRRDGFAIGAGVAAAAAGGLFAWSRWAPPRPGAAVTLSPVGAGLGLVGSF